MIGVQDIRGADKVTEEKGGCDSVLLMVTRGDSGDGFHTIAASDIIEPTGHNL